MKYKIYVSAYNEEAQQILVSFSSDETNHEAADYTAFAFDLSMYPDKTADEIVQELLRVAPNYCKEQITVESYRNDDEKSEAIRALVGREFEMEEAEVFGENGFRQQDGAENAEEL